MFFFCEKCKESIKINDDEDLPKHQIQCMKNEIPKVLYFVEHYFHESLLIILFN